MIDPDRRMAARLASAGLRGGTRQLPGSRSGGCTSHCAGTQTEQLPAGFTEKSAMVNGVRINYKIGGQGPAVVLLHGYAKQAICGCR